MMFKALNKVEVHADLSKFAKSVRNKRLDDGDYFNAVHALSLACTPTRILALLDEIQSKNDIIAALNLDNGLLRLAVEQKKALLEGCEIALSKAHQSL